jgi:hypothetical protein
MKLQRVAVMSQAANCHFPHLAMMCGLFAMPKRDDGFALFKLTHYLDLMGE